MAFADLAGVRLFYTDDGPSEQTGQALQTRQATQDPAQERLSDGRSDGQSREGTPLLLVHGWGADGHEWAWHLPRLSADRRVITPDLRGHGYSSAPADGFHPRDMAGDLLRLLDHLGIDAVIPIGHSMGAQIVSVLAVEQPSRVPALVCVEPGYGFDGAVAAGFPALARRLRNGLENGTTNDNGVQTELSDTNSGEDSDQNSSDQNSSDQNSSDQNSSDKSSGKSSGKSGRQGAGAVAVEMDEWSYTPASPPLLRRWHARRLLAMRPHVLAESFEAMFTGPDQFGVRPAADAYLARRECPVLSFWDDPARSAWEQRLFKHPASTAVTWPGSGHRLHEERPAEFLLVVAQWLARLRT
jgi:pimeloyl-ACP methyl ester carboxylesterase